MKTRQIYLEVEESDNCEYMPLQLYEGHGDPVPVDRVRIQDLDHPHGVYAITGWDSGGDTNNRGRPVPALYVPVSDSGVARVHLVYGGDYGLRFKPVNSNEDWDLDSPTQFGEPYLMLIDAEDILLNS